MSNYKTIIDQETKKFIEYAKELATLEINFRTYINEKGLSEESYKVASTEYSEAIKPLKEKITNVENQLAEITENTIGSYTTQDKDYTIDNTDLSRYQQIQSYNPGKPDPFAEYSEQTVPTNETGSGNSGNNDEPVDQNVTDNYYTSQNVGSGTK